MILEEWSGKLRLYRTLLLTFLTLNVFCLITAITLSVFYWAPAFQSENHPIGQLEKLTLLMSEIQRFKFEPKSDFERGVFSARLAGLAQELESDELTQTLTQLENPDDLGSALLAIQTAALNAQARLHQTIRSQHQAHQQQRLFLIGICTLSFVFGVILPLILLHRLKANSTRWLKTLDTMVSVWISRWGHALENWQNQGARGQFLIWLETGLLTLELFGAKSKSWTWRAAAEIARHLQQRLKDLLNAGASDTKTADSHSDTTGKSSEVKETA